MRYTVQAQIERTADEWTGSRGVPTFYVDAASLSEASAKVDTILNPYGYECAIHASILPTGD